MMKTEFFSNVSFDLQLAIRPLTAEDTHAYRALRRRILEIGDGKYFSDSYTREAQLTEPEWREWCTEKPEHCIIGTFVAGKLAGVMMVTKQDIPKICVAEWEATWLEPEYRRFGIAKLAYKKVWQWTKAHGYEFAIVFIRDDNTRSQEIRKKQGFTFVHTKRGEIWADGSVGDTYSFMLDLTGAKLNQRRTNATQHFQEVLASLNGDKIITKDGSHAAVLLAPPRPPLTQT
jgi:GNAT superfamily N-acetyltransferase